MNILRQNVTISRRLWLAVAVITTGLLSRVIIVQKGGETIRVYDFWLSAFKPSSYTGEEFGGIVVAMILGGLLTLIVFCISALVGWLVAAIFGSCSVLLGKRK
jgi:hypothetical protein